MNWRTTVYYTDTKGGTHAASVKRLDGLVVIGCDSPSSPNSWAKLGVAEAKRLRRDLSRIIREIEAADLAAGANSLDDCRRALTTPGASDV